MVSIKSTFQKMARLARDLSKKCNRDIEFITEGEDTELDKSVVENIGDPLIHMIRNSIDHGIEPPEERATTGKPLRALVKLRAFHRAGSIFIEVIDDGRGLNREAILAKAVSKGLCKPDANLSDQEVYQFIFLPGFSTAKVVTDVSGRGVGMDVVRRNIEALRGSVEITSTPGKGTTFSIRLPLTLAIVDGMVVSSGTDRYIIPTLAIIESIKAKKELISSVLGSGKLIKVREELIPLVHLGGVLRRSGEKWDIAGGIVMIVEDMLGKKIGLFLDEIMGQQQVVIKSLGNGMGDIPGVTGAAIMSDGTVCLILDVGGVVKLAGENNRNGKTEAVAEEMAVVC
jgi:two-component system chemotaxis sensor kinase CheA